MNKLTIKFTEEESCVASDASWRGSMRDLLEDHFDCRRKNEHITRVEVFDGHLRAFFGKGPRP